MNGNEKAGRAIRLTGRLGLLTALCLGFVFALAVTMAPGLATGQSEADEQSLETDNSAESSAVLNGPADPNNTLNAVEMAQGIQGEVLKTDDEKGEYDAAFVRRILSFYHYGTATAEDPGDPVVTRKFCREYTLALLRDLFNAGSSTSSTRETDSGGPQNPLDPNSARRLREALTTIMRTSPKDLSFDQRKRLYHLAGMVFTAQDSEAIEVLRVLVPEEESAGVERLLIIDTIKRIEERTE